MKKFVSALLVLAIILGLSPTSVLPVALAAGLSGSDGLWEWAESGEGVQLTAYLGNQTEVIVPATVEAEGETYSVVKLGDNLFKDNTTLTSISLEEGIQEIGDSAFAGAANLVYFAAPQSLTTIGSNAFEGCTAFDSITLYDAVTSIGADAFKDCPALTIYCNQNSEAYRYATDNGIKTKIMNPDVNPELIEENGITYYISNGTAAATAYDAARLETEVIIPGTVKGYPVTELQGTFSGNSRITSVTLPSSVTTIGDRTFYGCSKLKSVNIPDSVTFIGEWAFRDCRALTQVEVPGVRVISYQTFYGCDNLETVILSEGTQQIDTSAFSSCTKLTMVNIPASVTVIGYYAFQDCASLKNVTIPESVTEIGKQAFKGCTSLVKLAIPASVQTIYSDSLADNTVWLVTDGSYAHNFAKDNNRLYVIWDGVNELEFYDEDGITYLVRNGSAIALFSNADKLPTEITIPAMVGGAPVTELRGTFSGNKRITSVTLPSSVTLIGEQTFYDCDGLRSMSIPSGVTTIGKGAFENCGFLKSVSIPDSVTFIGEKAFRECQNLTQITVPGVGVIGSSTFYNCKSLETITLSEGTRQIGSSAFFGCSKLTTVALPASVTEIGPYAFESCTGLKSVTIPEGTTVIGHHAFVGCTSLGKVAIPANVQTLSPDSFADNTVWLVREDSYALSVAEKNDRLYVVWDGVNEPEFYDEGGITYQVTNSSAIAFSSDADVLPTEVTIPDTVKGAPVTELRGTFSGNSRITSVTLSDSVTLIGEQTFYNCRALQSVTIPNGVTTIGRSAFYGCSSLKSVDIPDSVTFIGMQAFRYCRGFTQVTVPGISVISYSMFDSCSNLETVILSEGTQQIDSMAFGDCSKLTTVAIPDSMTKISSSAFHSCTSLVNIAIPEGVTTIEMGAFEDCTSLRKLVIPPSVRTLYRDSLADSIVWIVTDGSYAHNFAKDNNFLFFVLPDWKNPEIAYGTEITGTVTYANGTPAADVNVEIFYNDGTSKEKVKTDADGSYTLTYAEVGRYIIQASDARGNTQNETVSVKRMNVFDVFLSGATDLVLKQGYTVSGSITPGGTATVTLSDTNGNVIATAENVSGSYSICNIPNGSYILKAENQTGSVLHEIRIYNADLTEDLDIPATSAAITGTVKVSNRDGSEAIAAWALVSAYNSEGVLAAQGRSDADGRFAFGNLPLDDYAIVAETAQMRPDLKKGYSRSHTLTGYAYISVTEHRSYDTGTIVLYEESDSTTTISGKVTANGQTQDCTVSLNNVFRFGVAVDSTNKNGKYIFKNIPDGLYFITAVTNKFGMGSTVVVVRNGVVYGETNIKVLKSDKVLALEEESQIKDIAEHEAADYTNVISEEKARFDSLSDKERQQLEQDYVEQLNLLAEKATNYNAEAPQGFTIANGGTLISKDEIAGGSQVALNLAVKEISAHEIPDDGIKTGEDYIQQMMEDAAGKTEIAGYYDISLTKNGQEISDISKQTDTAGKLRITMDIPQEYLGHTHYSMVHIHNGVPTILVDLDEAPNTATFEMNQFSTCALTYSDVPLTEKSPLTLDANDVTLRLGETAAVNVTLEEGVIQSISAVPAETAIVTAAVEGNIITLTPVAVGKTTVTVSVVVEGASTPLTDAITVQVLSADAGKYEIKLSAIEDQANVTIVSPQSTGATLFVASYREDGKMLDVACRTLELGAAQEQNISIPLNTKDASYLTAFLTDGTHPLAEARSVPIQREA